MADGPLSESFSLSSVVDDSHHLADDIFSNSADNIIFSNGGGTRLLVVDIISVIGLGTGLFFNTGVGTVG